MFYSKIAEGINLAKGIEGMKISFKRLKALLLLAGMTGILIGCEKKVVTVADMVTEEEEEQYIEIKEFHLKGSPAEDDTDTVKRCVVRVPAGYVESDEIAGMYVHERAPLDSSNIYYAVSDPGEMDYTQLSKETYESMMETVYQDAYSATLELTVESFEKQEMEGFPAYVIRSSYEDGEEKIEQLICLIVADKVYTVVFSQASDDELLADFDVMEGRITLIRE